MSDQDVNPAQTMQLQTMQQLAEVKGQLTNIFTLIKDGQNSTNQRIDDLRKSVETRFSGVEERLTRVEENERSTALRAAGSGALMGAIVAAGIELITNGKLHG